MESVIRAGGRATVYAARRHGVDGLRALKVIAIGSGSDARVVADAERRGAELQQAFARRHGLVPWVEEIGESRNCLYVAMELVPGEDLFDLLARGPVSQPHALEIAIELATFLEQAHGFEVPGRGTERIIHADLKPGNVRVRPDGHIRVLDFGIAKAMAEQRIVTTQKWGTRQYMSPEWLQTGTIDEQVDYWSLGVLLYEMVAGYRPFRRFERHDNQLEDAIRRGERPEALPSSIDLSIQQVLWRLLAPVVRQRYANASQIRAALEACRRYVHRDGAIAVAPVAAHSLAPGDSPATEPVAASVRADVPTAPMAATTHDSIATHWDSPPTEPVPIAGSATLTHALMPGDAMRAATLATHRDSPPTEPVPVAGIAPPFQAALAGASIDASTMSTHWDSPPTEPVSVPVPGIGVTMPPPLPELPALPVLAPVSGSASPSSIAFDTPTQAYVPAPASAQDAAIARRPPTRRDTLRKYVIVGLGVILTIVLASQAMSCMAAEHVRSDAAVADERELDAIVKRRMRYAGSSFFDTAMHFRADPVLKGRLVSLADAVIANYRQEQPTVTRTDWDKARVWLAQAVGLYPDDERLLSKLRYAEGQVQRLAGMQRADANQTKNARQSFYNAIQKFQEAASLDARSPDPYLGLTQTYIYGLGDVDAALDAQQAAEKRGYRLNRRERAAMGDGYRARGERTWRGARDLKGDQQREAYARAQEDFKRCVETFGPIVEFANAADQLHRCEARLAEIDNRNTPWWQRLLGSPKFELNFGDDPPRPDASRPNPSRPDASRPDPSRSDAPRPEAPR